MQLGNFLFCNTIIRYTFKKIEANINQDTLRFVCTFPDFAMNIYADISTEYLVDVSSEQLIEKLHIDFKRLFKENFKEKICQKDINLENLRDSYFSSLFCKRTTYKNIFDVFENPKNIFGVSLKQNFYDICETFSTVFDDVVFYNVENILSQDHRELTKHHCIVIYSTSLLTRKDVERINFALNTLIHRHHFILSGVALV